MPQLHCIVLHSSHAVVASWKRNIRCRIGFPFSPSLISVAIRYENPSISDAVHKGACITGQYDARPDCISIGVILVSCKFDARLVAPRAESMFSILCIYVTVQDMLQLESTLM